MRIDPLNQLVTAAVSLLLGVIFGVIYDVFRLLRRRCGITAVAVITDVTFCASVCAALYLLGYSLGGGHPRAYMAVFAIIGFAAYFALLSKAVLHILDIAADILLRILKIIAFPLKLFVVSIKKLMFFFKNTFYYKKKWYTIGWVTSVRVPNSKKSTCRTLRGNSNETEKGRYYY